MRDSQHKEEVVSTERFKLSAKYVQRTQSSLYIQYNMCQKVSIIQTIRQAENYYDICPHQGGLCSSVCNAET